MSSSKAEALSIHPSFWSRLCTRLGKNHWTGSQYSVLRAFFGGYLLIHFCMLLPYGAELFSNAGMVPDATLSPLYGLLPNPLAHLDEPWMIQATLALGAALAAAFALGLRDRFAALALWFILACLFNRNPLIANPSLPYVGWLLLAHSLLPSAPRGSWDARAHRDGGAGWRMPKAIFASAWIVMAVGYSYSGFAKLTSPSWLDGSALARVLANPLARPTVLREWLLALPDALIQLASWGALGLELCFLPLALSRRLRPFAWGAMLGMHLSLLVLIDFADLSVAMVILHLYTFDPAWAARPMRTISSLVRRVAGAPMSRRAQQTLLGDAGQVCAAAVEHHARRQSATANHAVPPHVDEHPVVGA